MPLESLLSFLVLLFTFLVIMFIVIQLISKRGAEAPVVVSVVAPLAQAPGNPRARKPKRKGVTMPFDELKELGIWFIAAIVVFLIIAAIAAVVFNINVKDFLAQMLGQLT